MVSKITKSRLFWGVLGTVAVLVLLAAALVVTRRANQHSKQTDPSVARDKGLPMPVKLGTVGTREVIEYTYVSALVSSGAEPPIYPPEPALVKKIYVTDGARVEAGDILIQLDTTDLEKELEADLALAEGARQKRDAAKHSLERKQALRAQELSTETEVEQAKNLLLDTELAVTKAEATVATVKRDIERYTISAPSRGIVRDIIDEGWKQVSTSTRLVDFTSTESLAVVGTVPEEYLPLITPDMGIDITVAALPGEKFIGHAAKGTPLVDPKTRTAAVRIQFDSPSPRLVPGMTAQARLAFQSNGTAIPLIALFNRTGRAGSVFRVVNQVAELRPIRLGRMSADWVEVLDGLAVGDVIVTTGQLYLKDGDKVSEVK